MSITNLTPVKFLKIEPLWLLSIAAGLQAITLTLVWRAHDVGHLGMSFLFLFATGSLLWDKRDQLRFESDVFSSVVGLLLIGWVLWESSTLNVEYTMRLFPFTSALGVALLASGFKGLKQYLGELMILFVLGIPSLVSELLYEHSIFDLSPWSAKMAGFLLWYSGFDVKLQGIYLSVGQGSVKVVYSCSGVDTINYILGIAVIALSMFPIARKKNFFVLIFATLLGFVLNAIRIALLAIFEGTNKEAFHSWHGGNASYSFGIAGILIFGLFYMLLLKQEERQIQKSQKSSGITH
ncbi:MAG: cyanoexosortase A [Gloeotrichia echinulata GP01]|jgi:cyanoexosortase A